MAASLSEVARLSGVSTATASRVLNPDSTYPISDSTRARVLAAAAALDYRSNALARGLKSRYARTVGVIVHDIRDPYFSEFARAIGDAAERLDFLPVVCSTDRDPVKELRYVEMLRENRVAGLLFVGGGFQNPEYVEGMHRQIKAIIEYGGRAIALGPRNDNLPAEIPDNRAGARDATAHLIGLGHRRIGLIDGPAGLMTSIERYEGYRAALADGGIPYDDTLVARGGFTEVGGARASAQLMQSDDPPTALFASNDLMALGAMQELRRRSLRIPQDVSLVGFDDLPFVRWLDPPLTTVAVSMARIGEAGMERLVSLLGVNSGDLQAEPTHRHPTQLVVRASTGRRRRQRPRTAC
jgi:LacI family transcriptional regulator